MKRLLAATAALCLSAPHAMANDLRPPDVTLYDTVLKQYVRGDGQVRYLQLHEDIAPLEAFVRGIGEVSPHSHPQLFPGREAQLAYWINAYNALVLWAFAQDYPAGKNRLGGLLGRGRFFYWKRFQVGGKKHSLSHIENKIIRGEFDESRIHFAIVCASSSCPWLSRDAYTAENLDEMLERETHRFLNQLRNIAIDPDRGTLTLSKLFDWFRKDFGDTREEILEFVARYRPSDADLLRREKWSLRYFDYDWSLNDAELP